MSEYRIEVVGEEAFNPREWLRRDVLWASLMSPYDQQMKGWIDGSQLAQHQGNVSRQNTYGKEDELDTEAQAMAFFNQGKNIAGLVTSAALFTAYKNGFGRGKSVDLLEVQAKNIDKVMSVAPEYADRMEAGEEFKSEKEQYELCSEAMVLNQCDDRFVRIMSRYDVATARMVGMAARETADWLETASNMSLPTLAVNNGAHPRSVGPRVEALKPIFESAVASPEYRALAEPLTVYR